jgi:hypothetical protein
VNRRKPQLCSASSVRSHIWSTARKLDIIINVPFTPDIVDAINAKARKQGLSGLAWIAMTVENALQLQQSAPQ